MSLKTYLKIVNPITWYKAYVFSKENAKFDKSSYDLELYLYSKILSNNMLHYGYFDEVNIEPDEISIKEFERAQVRYAELIVNQIKDTKNKILDVGCGMGGLSKMMVDKGYKVESLTPNKNQIAFINKNLPNISTHNCKFEDFKTVDKFGTIINSESLQYIPLQTAFDNVNKITNQNSRWIITDYFRLNNDGINKSSHLLNDFTKAVEDNGWKIIYEQDITKNILPTLRLINLYADRFLIPIKHFAFEKLRFKKPKLFFMTKDIREKLDAKLAKETAAINPEMFGREKQYVLFVLERS